VNIVRSIIKQLRKNIPHLMTHSQFSLAKNIFHRLTPSQFILAPEIVSDKWHHAFVEHLAFLLQPKVYVELGIKNCAVLNRIIPHAEHIIGVDINRKAGEFMIKSPKVRFFCSNTLDFAKQLHEKPISIDMLFIDADHACDAVLDDFWSFFPFVSPHGLILLHDTHPQNEEHMDPKFSGDAYKAVAELAKASDRLELFTLPVPPGLTLCRKRLVQLSWKE